MKMPLRKNNFTSSGHSLKLHRECIIELIEMACCGGKKMECVIRGYHIYKYIRAAVIGEVLVCTREATNAADRYAIVVMKDETIIGHLARKISKVRLVFLQRGGFIRWKLHTLYSDRE